MPGNANNDRKIVIATMHHKEKVIAPLIKKELGLQVIIPSDLDTDKFGTFSGETERTNDPIETLRIKCRAAIELTGIDKVVASEGSFGPHPVFSFVSADDELIMYYDAKNDLEIIARELSTDTNFNSEEIMSLEHLRMFSESVKFPKHGLIIRRSPSQKTDIIKGITDWAKLKEAYLRIKKNHGTAYAETDMRAMYNPTRMKVIGIATQKLITKIKSECPRCKQPGFDIKEIIPGLPCQNCGFPTRTALKHILGCLKCEFTTEKSNPHGKLFEEPQFCDYCNP